MGCPSATLGCSRGIWRSSQCWNNANLRAVIRACEGTAPPKGPRNNDIVPVAAGRILPVVALVVACAWCCHTAVGRSSSAPYQNSSGRPGPGFLQHSVRLNVASAGCCSQKVLWCMVGSSARIGYAERKPLSCESWSRQSPNHDEVPTFHNLDQWRAAKAMGALRKA